MQHNALGFARANSLRPAPIAHLVLTGILALGVGSVGHYVELSHRESAYIDDYSASSTVSVGKAVVTAPVKALNDAKNSIVNAVSPQPQILSREVELDDGQSFNELLTDAGVSDGDALAANTALSKVYDLRKLRAGQAVNLLMSLQGGQAEVFTGAVFMPEATKEISISRNNNGGFTAASKAIPVVRQRIAAAGEIRSSLYEAGDKVGVPHAVMASLMHIYAHDIDFQRDIHPGDHFEVLYDQPMTSQGKIVGEGSVIYASLFIGGKARPVYRVTFNDNSTDYFDDTGHSVRRTLLRTPVAAARVTSGFGMRMHPLLGYSKMHKGVDFGAPTGTPIFAAGNGTIEDIGFRNGYGRYIRIHHNDQLATAYAHMSRFNPNLYRGARVAQGEVIGYVGMTGRATGPHLHFEVHVNGRQVNPMSVNLPTGRVLDGKLLALFRQGKTKINSEFDKLLASRATSPIVRVSGVNSAYPTKIETACGSSGGC